MKKIERRDFLKLAGGAVCGGVVGTTLSGAPFLGLQWLVEWSQDQYVPASGEERFVGSVCQACGTNISIRKIGDRAVKVETANSGCPVCQAMLQVLYHPARIQTPLKRVGGKGSGRFEAVSWETALNEISGAVTRLRSENKPQAIAAINAAENSISNLLLERLVNAAGSKHVYAEPGFRTASERAVKLTQNLDGSLDYDFENADYILSFGARLFEGWGNAARMNRALLQWKERNAKFVMVDTLCTRTAAMADRWVAIKPGTEAILALGIAHQLINNHGKSANLSDLARWSGINEFNPQRVSELTGVPAATIAEVARDFVSAPNAVAVAGRGGQAVGSSVPEIIAVQCLNALIAHIGRRGNSFVKTAPAIGVPVQYDEIARAGHANSHVAKGLDDFIKNGERTELLFINEANPVYNSVYGQNLVRKMRDIPMVVALGAIKNDTMNYADYILPTLTLLEVPAGNAAAAVAPRFRSKHGGEIIIEIAKKVDRVSAAFPWNSLQEAAGAVRQGQANNAGNFRLSIEVLSTYFDALTRRMAEAQARFPLVMIPFEIPLVGDGRNLALPYVLKGICGENFSGGKLYVQMNPATARQYRVSNGSSIDIESSRGEIGSVKVLVTKTVAPGVVAIPVGFGHTDYTKYGSNKGVNPKEIMTDALDPESGAADWWYTRVKIS